MCLEWSDAILAQYGRPKSASCDRKVDALGSAAPRSLSQRPVKSGVRGSFHKCLSVFCTLSVDHSHCFLDVSQDSQLQPTETQLSLV